MSVLNTDFNVNPYYDDFEEDADFYRVLFRPATPVQARELTQLQTILNQQIKRFGDHVFKDGSVVDGCHVTYHDPFRYVSVGDSFASNADLSVSEIESDMLLVGNTSGVRAICHKAVEGFEASFPESNRFYVSYLRTGANSESTFTAGEWIKVYTSDQGKHDTSLNNGNLLDQIQVINDPDATGEGYGVTIGDGIIYHKGFFQRVESQTIVIKEFDTDPTNYRVGFDTLEEIITEDQDESLNDNALGYPNFNAPGAHRLKLTPVLVSKLRTETTNNVNFFAIVEFDNREPTEQNIDPVYNKLGDEFGRRTSEESGDYHVKPFTIETFPGINANTGLEDANLFAYSISTGIAYVKGYRIEKIGTSNIVTTRAFTTQTSEAQIVTANYGKYVIVDQMLGTFDYKNLDEVQLYDQAQASITDLEDPDAARSGNNIGNAHIRMVEHYSGTKGIANCQYLVYLDNVRMNSGQSFSDVKAIYANTAGYSGARADVVLETQHNANGSTSNVAILHDGELGCLVFPTGARATKSLYDNSGASDTQFVFRDYANATLAVNGFISVTTNPAAAGGSERINASGTITSLAEKANFDVVLTVDVLTTNLAGTVSGNTTVANLVGTSTAFDVQFKAGQYIKCFHQGGGGFDYRRIVSVTNATHMVLAANLTQTNTAMNYAKLYPEGSHVDLSSASANIIVASNTTLQINSDLELNAALTATSTVHVHYPVLKHDAFPIGKDVRKDRYVKIDCSNNGITGPWCLGFPDVYDIQAVYAGTTYDVTNPDQSHWFEFDDGQRDAWYDLATLRVKPAYRSKVSASSKLLVKFSYFNPNTNGGVGFYSVDSYPTSNTANSTTIEWGEIPTYRTSAGEVVDLRDAVDFRLHKANTAADATAVGSATINPANSGVGFAASTIGYHPEPDSNFQADITTYLPRRDLVVVNKLGDFTVVQGQPGVFPTTPTHDDDVMLVATAYVPAWPTLSQREAESLGRHDLKVRHDIKTNRRYTMRDVGVIDQRLKRVEYYTVLNALEQKARDFTVPDVDGLDRFKNGIFADPFNSHSLGKVTDQEYRVSIDQDYGVARPPFRTHAVDFTYNSSNSTTQRTGNYVTLPYTHVAWIHQHFASKIRNCVESQWAWTGKCTLYPNFDNKRDETRVPNQNITMDLSQPWEDFFDSSFGSQFGDWRTVQTSNTRQTNTVTSGRTTTTTTTETRTRIVEELQMETMTNQHQIGPFVRDVSLEPYIRPRMVAFVATNLKPNTRIHAFFDNVNVDAHCAPADYSNVTNPEEGREDKILTRTGAFGANLTSDSAGNLLGLFSIPAGTFRQGDRNFLLCDVSDLVTGNTAILTRADARFTAAQLAVTTQGVTLNTIEPEIGVVTTTNTQVIVTTTTQTRNPPRPRNTGGGRDWSNMRRGYLDPLAQSIFANIPTSDSGAFATKLDLFFESKDPSLGITVFVTEMRFGFPDTTRIIGRAYLTSDEVNVSDDGTEATTFTFDHPVYMTNGEKYALMVKPDGDSPEYRIWIGETGEFDVDTGVQIYQNPYAGVLFTSSNMNTWSSHQKEDMKFILYRAQFTAGSSAVAVLDNETDEFITYSGLVRSNSDILVQVGDLVYTANDTHVLTGANTTQPFGIVQFIDEPNETVYLDSSTGGWAAGANIQFHRPTAVGNVSLITANSRIANAELVSVDDLDYHAIVPRYATLKPNRTNLVFTYRGYDSSDVQDGFKDVVNNTETEFLDFTRIVKSYSNELADISGNKSCRFRATFSTESEFVSPVIDLRSKTGLAIENIVNNSDTNEANSNYGEALAKYVSKNVVLKDGQEAEDILVHVTAWRPSGTDVQVYVKFLNQEDGEAFDTKKWTKLTAGTGAEMYSDQMNTRDFVEIEYTLPTAVPSDGSNPRAVFANSSTGIAEYSSATGAVYRSYKTFCLKIVMLAEDAALAPRLNDVRAIALQV